MLKNKLYRDTEAFAGDNSTLDLESIHDMDMRERDREEIENEINEDVAAADEASQTVVEVQEAVAELSEAVENMNPVEVGKAIGAIEDKLDTIAENVEEVVVDTEALAAGNLVDGVRKEIEAISDKLKSAWQAVKNFFKSVWAKIKQMMMSFVLWLTDGAKKTKDIIEKLSKKSDDRKDDLKAEDFAGKVGSRLGTMTVLGFKTSEISGWVSKITNGADSSSIDDKAVKDIKAGKFKLPVNIQNNHIVKATRFDGTSLKVALAISDAGTIAYEGYYTATMTPAVAASTKLAIAKEVVGSNAKKYALDLLGAVEGIAGEAKKLKEVLYKEMTEINSIIDKDVEAASFKQGVFKMVWSKTLGSKSVDQYTAEEKVKAIRNRSSFTSNATKGVLFGLNSLIKDINGIGTLVASTYKDAE